MAETEDRRMLEEIEVKGAELIAKVKELIQAGNVRTLRIVAQDGDTALELPLTIGVLAGGALVLAAPWLAVLGVIAAMAAHVRILVERGPDAPAAEPASEGAEARTEPPA